MLSSFYIHCHLLHLSDFYVSIFFSEIIEHMYSNLAEMLLDGSQHYLLICFIWKLNMAAWTIIFSD